MSNLIKTKNQIDRNKYKRGVQRTPLIRRQNRIDGKKITDNSAFLSK